MMEPALQVLIGGMVTFGVPVAMAVWLLRAKRDDGPGDNDRRVGDKPPRPTGPGHVRSPRPLPSCLIPSPPGPMSRVEQADVLELA